MSAIEYREGHTGRRDVRGGDPNDDDEAGPELVTDETIELLLRGAKALVIVINVVVLITFAILSLGFFLHLAGASPEATFVDWVYRNTNRAMQPFRGMFPVQEIDDRSVFDASLLFAAAVYGFMAISLHAVVDFLSAKVRRYRRRSLQAAAAAAAARRAQTTILHETGPEVRAPQPQQHGTMERTEADRTETASSWSPDR